MTRFALAASLALAAAPAQSALTHKDYEAWTSPAAQLACDVPAGWTAAAKALTARFTGEGRGPVPPAISARFVAAGGAGAKPLAQFLNEHGTFIPKSGAPKPAYARSDEKMRRPEKAAEPAFVDGATAWRFTVAERKTADDWISESIVVVPELKGYWVLEVDACDADNVQAMKHFEHFLATLRLRPKLQ